MELKQLIENYQPSEATAELVRSAHIVLLVGISGAGKDTVKKQLLGGGDYHDIVSHTTRAPRQNDGAMEVNGVDYHFINNDAARQLVLDQKFVEAKFVHGTVYGTSAQELRQAKNEQKIAVTDIDVQGVTEYKELSQSAIAIFILPPSYEVWRQRLRTRYQTAAEFEAEWPRRRASAIAELSHALNVPYYHFIINDDLSRTVRITDEIARRVDQFNRKDDEARLAARDLLAEIETRTD